MAGETTTQTVNTVPTVLAGGKPGSNQGPRKGQKASK